MVNRSDRGFIRANSQELKHLPPAGVAWQFSDVRSPTGDPEGGLTWSMFRRLHERDLITAEQEHTEGHWSEGAHWQTRSDVFDVLEDMGVEPDHAYAPEDAKTDGSGVPA